MPCVLLMPVPGSVICGQKTRGPEKRFFSEQPSGVPQKTTGISHCADSTNTTFKDLRTYEDNVKHSNDLRV